MNKLKNGILIEIAEGLIYLFNKLNLVEYFKNIAHWVTKDKKKRIHFKSLLIDIFIILKYLFVIALIYFKLNSSLLTIFVWYLIISNLHTYFYRHLWIAPYSNKPKNIRRRFISLTTSFVFSNLSFYYLYLIPYAEHFKVAKDTTKELSFFIYSIYNSIFGSYNFVEPIGNYGAILALVQLSITFIFISIILSNSIPQLNKE